MDNLTKPKCFITSVGTSIVENSGRNFIDVVSSNEEMDAFLNRCHQDKQFTTAYLDNHVKSIIDNKKYSAEIDALKDIVQEADRIVFLPSKTDISYFCACVLKSYFSRSSDPKHPKLPDDQIEIAIVDGLRDPKDEAFETRGLPDFLNAVVQKIQYYSENYEIVLNPTGGYKSLFPLMTIAGIIYSLKVIYTYERTNQLIQIPPLPLHVNLPAWTQMETLIQIFDGKADFENRKMYKETKDRFGLMLYPSENKLRGSALSQAFKEHASKERGKPELIVRTENSPLVNFLHPEHRKIFMRLTEIGHLIWKGDRVPEMADHALRHHSDLFHLAERVLLPIFYYDEKFLEPHELFILLCALYLHDCGHVIDRIQLENGKSLPLPLFPVEIRDHHHVLGYLRLKYPEIPSYMGYPLYDHLCETFETDPDREKKWAKAWNDYLHAVATIGLYHRKKMFLDVPTTYVFYDAYPLKEEHKRFFCLREHLQKNPVSVFGQPVLFERMKLLISLLRIIDSLDEQASRTGNAVDIKFHLAQLKMEADIEAERSQMILSEINPASKEEIDQIMERYILGFKIKEEKGFKEQATDEKKQRAIEKTEIFRKEIETLIEKSKDQSILLREYVEASLRSFFKQFQIIPYGEKAYIKGIEINCRRDEINNITTLIIDLRLEDDPEKLKTLKEMFPKNNLEEHKCNMLNSIRTEYTNQEKADPKSKEGRPVVKDTLKTCGVQFQYGDLNEY